MIRILLDCITGHTSSITITDTITNTITDYNQNRKLVKYKTTTLYFGTYSGYFVGCETKENIIEEIIEEIIENKYTERIMNGMVGIRWTD